MVKLHYSVSIVIATYNRPEDLREALESALSQSERPAEVIVVDDSPNEKTLTLVNSMKPAFAAVHVDLGYLRNPGERSLTAARNLGVKATKGDIILFLDDDVILDREYLAAMALVYSEEPGAMGVQGFWTVGPVTNKFLLLNALNRLFLLNSYRIDQCTVLPSFVQTYPYALTRRIQCECLSGCNQSYRRIVFDRFMFDDALKQYAPGGEDLDFSYRIHKCYRGSLFITPEAKLVHKSSPVSRMPSKRLIYLRDIYSCYFFKKNLNQSVINRVAFAWSRIGEILSQVAPLSLNGRNRQKNGATRMLGHIVNAHVVCFKHRKEIARGDLSFARQFTDM